VKPDRKRSNFNIFEKRQKFQAISSRNLQEKVTESSLIIQDSGGALIELGYGARKGSEEAWLGVRYRENTGVSLRTWNHVHHDIGGVGQLAYISPGLAFRRVMGLG
jgi:hypothetical protein